MKNAAAALLSAIFYVGLSFAVSVSGSSGVASSLDAVIGVLGYQRAAALVAGAHAVAGGVLGALAARLLCRPFSPLPSAMLYAAFIVLVNLGSLADFFDHGIAAILAAVAGPVGFLVASRIGATARAAAESSTSPLAPEVTTPAGAQPAAVSASWPKRLGANLLVGFVAAGSAATLFPAVFCGMGTRSVTSVCEVTGAIGMLAPGLAGLTIIFLAWDTLRPWISGRVKFWVAVAWAALLAGVYGAVGLDYWQRVRARDSADRERHVAAMAELARYEADPSSFALEECWVEDARVQVGPRLVDGEGNIDDEVFSENREPLLSFGVTLEKNRADRDSTLPSHVHHPEADGLVDVPAIVQSKNINRDSVSGGGHLVLSYYPELRARCFLPENQSPFAGVDANVSNVVVASVFDADGTEVPFPEYLATDFQQALREPRSEYGVMPESGRFSKTDQEVRAEFLSSVEAARGALERGEGAYPCEIYGASLGGSPEDTYLRVGARHENPLGYHFVDPAALALSAEAYAAPVGASGVWFDDEDSRPAASCVKVLWPDYPNFGTKEEAAAWSSISTVLAGGISYGGETLSAEQFLAALYRDGRFTAL